MSQHDMVIDNQLGAALRGDLNNALAALVTQNSGATAPATTYAYMWWADTTTGLLKQRNAANTAWIVKGPLGIGGSFTASTTVAKSGAYTVLVDDIGSTFVCTGTWTLSFTAAATLGNGFTTCVRNGGTGVITLDPNGAELINGQATITLNPGESVWLVCSGTAWVTTSADWINKEGTAIASAATINLDAVYGDFVHVTGTTGITAVTLAQGVKKVVVFDGALTITNGASLICFGGVNITTVAAEAYLFIGEGAGVVRCIGLSFAARATSATSATSATNSTTQAVGDNTTAIATTAFCEAGFVNNDVGSAGVGSFFHGASTGSPANGATVAGSTLYALNYDNGSGVVSFTSTPLAGTWRNISGRTLTWGSPGNNLLGILQRIS